MSSRGPGRRQLPPDPASASHIAADAGKLLRFVSLYCRDHHADRPSRPFSFRHPRTAIDLGDGALLCGECERLLRHALAMRALCPLDPKPKCRKCPQNCYREDHRLAMERVMRYAGPRSLLPWR